VELSLKRTAVDGTRGGKESARIAQKAKVPGSGTPAERQRKKLEWQIEKDFFPHGRGGGRGPEGWLSNRQDWLRIEHGWGGIMLAKSARGNGN